MEKVEVLESRQGKDFGTVDKPVDAGVLIYKVLRFLWTTYFDRIRHGHLSFCLVL